MKINGLSSEQKKQLSALMQAKIDCGAANGSALCIMQDGKELYRENFGFADKEAGKPIKNNTIYRLFSMSKPIISVAAHILIERGLLGYDDAVEDYIPAFADKKLLTIGGIPAFEANSAVQNVNEAVGSEGDRSLAGASVSAEVPVKTKLRIRHLLNMTSGVYYPDGSPCGQLYGAVQDEINRAFEAGTPYSTKQVAEMLGKLPLGFEPGTHWNYSTGADIMGAVIEAVSGRKLGDFLKDEIFLPLGMEDTGFKVPADKLDRYTVMYDWPNAEHKQLWPHEVFIFCVQCRELDNPFESGGAGLVSSIDDFGKFAQMLVNKGEFNGRRILKPETVEMMLTPTIEEEAKKDLTWDSLQGYTYSNFFRIMEDPAKTGYKGTPGEFGWDGWTGNFFFCDPENKLVFLYFVQLCGGGDVKLMHELAKVIYG